MRASACEVFVSQCIYYSRYMCKCGSSWLVCLMHNSICMWEIESWWGGSPLSEKKLWTIYAKMWYMWTFCMRALGWGAQPSISIHLHSTSMYVRKWILMRGAALSVGKSFGLYMPKCVTCKFFVWGHWGGGLSPPSQFICTQHPSSQVHCHEYTLTYVYAYAV